MIDSTVPASRASAHTVAVQRVENALIAVAILVTVWAFGLPWWVLFAAFLLFDLSFLGYLRNERLGAIVYNAVHSYVVPAVLAAITAILYANGASADWLALITASWAFHVAVDRALGYGLKLGSFQHTHLGVIGKSQVFDE